LKYRLQLKPDNRTAEVTNTYQFQLCSCAQLCKGNTYKQIPYCIKYYISSYCICSCMQQSILYIITWCTKTSLILCLCWVYYGFKWPVYMAINWISAFSSHQCIKECIQTLISTCKKNDEQLVTLSVVIIEDISVCLLQGEHKPYALL